MSRRAKQLKLLMIGPLPPPIGGATLLFESLVDDLAKYPNEISIQVINLSHNRKATSMRLWTAFQTIVHTFIKGQHSNVITFHANQYGRLYLGPIIYIIAWLLRKPLIVRAFGGTFDQQFEKMPRFIRQIMLKTFFEADVCLLETKRMVNYFNAIPIRRAEWFSNYTNNVGLSAQTPFKQVCNKFVFVGRIVPSKGIDELFATASLLDNKITIDVYGPLSEHYTIDDLNTDCDNIRYKGLIPKTELAIKLWDYDALVLPTYWEGEGYPAVILEAYAHGIPVITTDWQSLPEIVDDTCGILVQPRDAVAVAEAINRLHRDQLLYFRLQEGSRQKHLLYLQDFWVRKFVTLCQELVDS